MYWYIHVLCIRRVHIHVHVCVHHVLYVVNVPLIGMINREMYNIMYMYNVS